MSLHISADSSNGLSKTRKPTSSWLFDSGSNVHVTNCPHDILYPSACKHKVHVGTGHFVTARKKGTTVQKDKKGKLLVLHDVLVVPEFTQKIVSMGKLMDDHMKIYLDNKANSPTITIKGHHPLCKATFYRTPNGMFWMDGKVVNEENCTGLHNLIQLEGKYKSSSPVNSVFVASAGPNMSYPTTAENEEQQDPLRQHLEATTAKERAFKKPISMSQAHELLGHASEEPVRKTMKRLNIPVIGPFPACTACFRAKAKAKKVAKITADKATKPGERLFIDLSGPYFKSAGGTQYWILVVDDFTRFAWSYFVTRKSMIRHPLNQLLNKLKGDGLHVKYIRCDNAGENTSHVKSICDRRGITIELTSPYTPQYNGVVERKFVTIRDRAQAMMISAQLNMLSQRQWWPEAIYTATKLSNITSNSNDEIPPQEKWTGKPSNLYKHLKEWGRIGWVTYKDHKVGKMKDKAYKCMLFGYSENHAPDTYRMLNLKTRAIIDTRDVRWEKWHGLPHSTTQIPVFDLEEPTEENIESPSSSRPTVIPPNQPTVQPPEGPPTQTPPPTPASTPTLIVPIQLDSYLDHNSRAGRITPVADTQTRELFEPREHFWETETERFIEQDPDENPLGITGNLRTATDVTLEPRSTVLTTPRARTSAQTLPSTNNDVKTLMETLDSTTPTSLKMDRAQAKRNPQLPAAPRETRAQSRRTRSGAPIRKATALATLQEQDEYEDIELEHDLCLKDRILSSSIANQIEPWQALSSPELVLDMEIDEAIDTDISMMIKYDALKEMRHRQSVNYITSFDHETDNENNDLEKWLINHSYHTTVNDERTKGSNAEEKWYKEGNTKPYEPKTVHEAINGRDKEKWKESMKDEINNFIQRGVWKQVDKKSIPSGRSPVRCRWVFKVKTEQDHTFRYKSRCVVLGYALKPLQGDVYETFSPVASEVSVRLLLGYALYKKWICHMIDVQAAFLESEIDEDLWVVWPEGSVELGIITEKEKNTTCAKLLKAQYGCAQAPRCWYKKLSRTLKEMGLQRSKTDPCVFLGYDAKGKLNLALITVVDDTLIIGETETVLSFKKEFKKLFTVTDLGEITKHLGIWYERKTDNEGEFFEMSMTDFAEDLVKDYEKEMGKPIKTALSPGIPGKSLLKAEEGAEPINLDKYRSFVGRIMWYMRKLTPQCCNAMRELASHMSCPTVEHWKALTRAIGFVKNNLDRRVKIRAPKTLRIISYTDSDWAGNKDTRRSVSSFIVTMGGMPLILGSKTQRVVSLSSSEAELVALTLCAQESKFAQMLLEELDNNTQRPMLINVDNTGAIFLAENQAVGGRTKHIDTRVSFIRDLIEDEYCRLQYVKTENNYADIGSKNQTIKLFTEMEEVINNGMLMKTSPRMECNMIRASHLIEDDDELNNLMEEDVNYAEQGLRDMPHIPDAAKYGRPNSKLTLFKMKEGTHWTCFDFVNASYYFNRTGRRYGIASIEQDATTRIWYFVVKGPPCPENRKVKLPDVREYSWKEALLLFPKAVAACCWLCPLERLHGEAYEIVELGRSIFPFDVIEEEYLPGHRDGLAVHMAEASPNMILEDTGNTEETFVMFQDRHYQSQEPRNMPHIPEAFLYGEPHPVESKFPHEGSHWECFDFVNGNTEGRGLLKKYGITLLDRWNKNKVTVEGPPCEENRILGRPDIRIYSWEEAVLLFPEALAAHIEFAHQWELRRDTCYAWNKHHEEIGYEKIYLFM